MKNKINFINCLILFGILWFVFGCADDESEGKTNPPTQRPRDSAPANKRSGANPATFDSNGNLIIPQPRSPLTVADLAGEWGQESGLITTTYVDRSDGSYAGSDHLAFRSKMSITSSGEYKNDFFAVRNGKKEIDNTTGTIRVVGSTIFIKETGLTKYVVRGWLELPNMTILTICGPWFDDQEIPSEIFTNPEQGANLNKNWVRIK